MYMRLSLHYSKNCVIACMHTCVCQKTVYSYAIPGSISKQIQMVVVVGLPFQCHGLYCLFEREDEPLGQRGYMNDKTVKHQMSMQFHARAHTHMVATSLFMWRSKSSQIFPQTKSRHCINQSNLPKTTAQYMKSNDSY